MHCVKKNNLFLARLLEISAIRMKIRRYNSQAFANIKFPENLQTYIECLLVSSYTGAGNF